MCLAGLMLIVAAPVNLVLWLTLGQPLKLLLVCLKCWVVFFIKTIAIPDYSPISISKGQFYSELVRYFVFISLYTDVNIFRLVFC